jgi:small GTP-binding protein
MVIVQKNIFDAHDGGQVVEKAREYRFKIILIGSGGVGKTSLVRKYVEKAFTENYLPTIGANVMEKDISMTIQGKASLIKLTIWDIAAQDTFKRMRPTFYAGATGAFLVADLSRPESFDELLNWDKELNALIPNISKLVLANKSDLEPHISEEELQEIGRKIKPIEVLKTSAMNGENVNKAFKTLTKQLVERNTEMMESRPPKRETDWRSTVQYIYVIEQSGLLLYEQDMHQSYSDIGKARDSAILGGALIAISSLLKEIALNANPLKVISQEGFCILIEEGQHVLVALVTTEELQTSRQKLQEFLAEFERKFEGKIQDNINKGDIRQAFKTAGTLAKRIFN